MDKRNDANFCKKRPILIDKKSLITDLHENNVKKINEKKCVCQYSWNNELHGLTAFLKGRTLFTRIFWCFVITICVLGSVITAISTFGKYYESQTITYDSIKQPEQGLTLPVIVLCPKNADSLNFDQILNDIDQRLPLSSLNRSNIVQLIRFAVAGAGFSNVEQFKPIRREKPKKLSDLEIQQLDALFHRWLGTRTLSEFYKNLFEDWGYKCHEFIQKCYLAYKLIHNCCSLFEPYFVLLRGRCLRLNTTLTQRDPADNGRFEVHMNQMASRLSNSVPKKQTQVVAYLTDTDRNVGLFPRYYINFRTAVMLRVRARQISMLPDGNSDCQNYPKKEEGRNTCRLKQWLEEKTTSQYNCTLFYLNFDNGTICEPKTIVENYERITDLRLNKSNREMCLPACQRNEHIFTDHRLRASIINELNYVPPFRMEVYFSNLQIQVYKEVRTLTVFGFISQLGGQMGLYVGLSVCSFCQIIFSVILKYREWREKKMEKRRREANLRKKLNCWEADDQQRGEMNEL